MGSNQKRLSRLIKSGSGKLVLVGAIAGGGIGLLVGTAGIGLLVGAATGFAIEASRKK